MSSHRLQVASVVVTIPSYTDILEDGISFRVSGVEVEVEPNQEKKGISRVKSSSVSEPGTGGSSSGSSQRGAPPASAEGDGLQFLANWVDLIIAKLRVSVEDVKISMFGSGVYTDCPLVIVKLGDIEFYNSNPLSSGRAGSSVSFNESYRSHSASVSFLPGFGKQKVGDLSIFYKFSQCATSTTRW